GCTLTPALSQGERGPGALAPVLGEGSGVAVVGLRGAGAPGPAADGRLGGDSRPAGRRGGGGGDLVAHAGSGGGRRARERRPGRRGAWRAGCGGAGPGVGARGGRRAGFTGARGQAAATQRVVGDVAASGAGLAPGSGALRRDAGARGDRGADEPAGLAGRSGRAVGKLARAVLSARYADSLAAYAAGVRSAAGRGGSRRHRGGDPPQPAVRAFPALVDYAGRAAAGVPAARPAALPVVLAAPIRAAGRPGARQPDRNWLDVAHLRRGPRA